MWKRDGRKATSADDGGNEQGSTALSEGFSCVTAYSVGVITHAWRRDGPGNGGISIA